MRRAWSGVRPQAAISLGRRTWAAASCRPEEVGRIRETGGFGRLALFRGATTSPRPAFTARTPVYGFGGIVMGVSS